MLFLDRPGVLTESLNFSENDKCTENYNSEHFQSTLFADQSNTSSTILNSKSNER